MSRKLHLICMKTESYFSAFHWYEMSGNLHLICMKTEFLINIFLSFSCPKRYVRLSWDYWADFPKERRDQGLKFRHIHPG